MRRHGWCWGLGLIWLGLAVGPGPVAAVAGEPDEVLALDALADAARWVPSECTLEAAPAERRAEGRPTLHIHMPVDHHGGEARYPIGWPRLYCALQPGDERAWSDYDRFEFMILAEMTRTTLPQTPLVFQMHCPEKPDTTNRTLQEIELGKWVRITVPTADIRQVDRIARLGLNISESEYRHGEILDFYVGGFRLVRPMECRVERLTPKAPVIFADRGGLPVELVVNGPPERVSRGVPFTLSQGDRVLRLETLPVRRGVQVLEMDVSELRLAPGDYGLTAFAADPERRQAASFRVVTSPWKEP